jgi:hypothetical protein
MDSLSSSDKLSTRLAGRDNTASAGLKNEKQPHSVHRPDLFRFGLATTNKAVR